jgi:hypothetical protein
MDVRDGGRNVITRELSMRARQVAMAGLAVVTVPLLMVLAPSAASAAGVSPSCAKASNSTFGVAAATGPQQREGKGTANVVTGDGKRSDEIVGTECFTRIDAGRAKISFNWQAIGHLYEGIFWYQLADCATGEIANERSKALEYDEGTPDNVTSGSATAEFPLEPGHTYKALVRGAGKFDRGALAQGMPGVGTVGHFGQYYNPEVDAGLSNDPNANKFYGEGACA